MKSRKKGTKKASTKSDKIVARKMSKVMKEFKKGELRSGRSGKKVKSRKQAVAIGLSEARQRGARIPRKKKSSKKS